MYAARGIAARAIRYSSQSGGAGWCNGATDRCIRCSTMLAAPSKPRPSCPIAPMGCVVQASCLPCEAARGLESAGWGDRCRGRPGTTHGGPFRPVRGLGWEGRCRFPPRRTRVLSALPGLTRRQEGGGAATYVGSICYGIMDVAAFSLVLICAHRFSSVFMSRAQGWG